MSIFTAKKEIPAQDINVESGRVLITPPSVTPATKENPKIEVPATVNFQIEGVKPINLLDKEWEDLKAMFVIIACRASNLKEVTATAAVTK